MNGRTVKAARKAASDASRATAAMVMPDFAALVRANHALTQRVEEQEQALGEMERRARVAEAFRSRSFAGRLRWLLRGL